MRTNGSGGRWHYPANFEDAMPEPARKKSKKRKDKKDRWARTEDAYSIGDGETSARRKKSSRKRRATVDSDTVSRQSDQTNDFPEDAEGGLYGPTRGGAEPADGEANGRTDEDYIFRHEL